MTRDQIAALKSSEGWGRVFKQMKTDGLISARNLGQVVNQHEHQLQPGDSLYLRSTQLHRWHNQQPAPAVLLWVNVPLVEAEQSPARARRAVRRRHCALPGETSAPANGTP